MSASGLNLENYLIPLEEIKRATENFNQQLCIGDGGFGKVYKGQLFERWDNRTAAIKRRDWDSKQGEREFRDELEMSSRFHHENIISFIGYCDQGNEMILVYEYAMNGSLDHHLGDPSKIGCITWTQRLKICIEAAKGLRYLHSGLEEHNRVIHRDVKSANILLGDNLIAKICDFGLSRSGPKNQPDTQLYTRAAGTQFYMDPSYGESRILRKESDVYSFGVVLFEMLSGMLVYREGRIGDNERQFLMTSIRRYHDKPEKLIDPCIRHEIDGPSFDMFKEVAYQCISLNSMERPTMDQVVKRIEAAFTIQTSVHSKIRSILRKLDSVVPTDQWAALSEIFYFAKTNDRNRLVIAQAGAIPLLTDLLTASDSLTREHAVTILCVLSITEDNRGTIVSSEAVPKIIHILSFGSMKARVNAAATLLRLSVIDENKVTIGAQGAIPPLVLLLSEGTQSGKEYAAGALGLLIRYEGNAIRVVRAGVVPILMDLLTEPDGDLKNAALAILVTLSSHSQGIWELGKVEAVPVLFEIIWSGSQKNKKRAATVLMRHLSDDQKDLFQEERRESELRECVLRKLRSVFPTDRNRFDIAEAGAIPLITDLLIASDFLTLTQDLAIKSLYILSISKGDRGSIVSLGAVPRIIHVLSQGTMEAREYATGTLAFLSEIEENRVTFGDAGAILPLVLLLSEATQNGKVHAAIALLLLCKYEGNIGRVVRAGVVPILMDLLTEPEGYLKNKTMANLFLLSSHTEGRLAIDKAEAVPVLVELLGTGSMEYREDATVILLQLCFEDKKYLMEAQKLGVMEKLMDLEQHGTFRGKRKARQLLEKISSVQRWKAVAQDDLGKQLLEKTSQAQKQTTAAEDDPGKQLLAKTTKARRRIYSCWKR